ncbi:MAG TPA: delta-60 repeat domain-containing protein [Gammaproteobacteria bacterium]
MEIPTDAMEGKATTWALLSPSADGSVVVFGSVPETDGELQKAFKAVRIDGAGNLSGEIEVITIDELTTTIGPSRTDVRWASPAPGGGFLVAGHYTHSGSGTPQEGFIVRLTADLELNPDFSPIVLGGAATFDPHGLAVGRDGSIWLLAQESTATTDWSAVYKFSAEGEADTSFGENGVLKIDPDLENFRSLAVTPSNRLLLYEWSLGVPKIVAFTEQGVIDQGYGTGGTAVLAEAGDCSPVELRALPDGSLQIAGLIGASEYLDYDLCLVRLTPDGALDVRFGDGGKAVTDFQVGEVGWSFSFDENGDIVLLSDAYYGTSRIFAKPIITRHYGLFPDVIPDPLVFEAEADVEEGVLLTSAALVVGGLDENVSVPVRVEGGEYRISGEEWTTEPGWIGNGGQIAVRHTSADSPGGGVETQLRIGGWLADDGESVMGETTNSVFRSTVKASAVSPDGGGGGGGAFSYLLLAGLLLASASRRRQR